MTVPNLMTREELLESASLDALGLLDEYEADHFTRSFHHAPAAVQKEIIELQGELMSDDSILPNENPDPALKFKVLGAVAHAVEKEIPELEPLATIGKGSAHTARRRHDDLKSYFAGSTSKWRVASFVLAAGVIVMLYAWADASRHGNRIATLALMSTTDEQLERLIGPTIKDYLRSNDAVRVVLAPPSQTGQPSGTQPWANLWISEGSDTAFLVVEGLPRSDEPVYTISVVDAVTGKVQQLRSIGSNGKLFGAQIVCSLSLAQLQNVTFQITDNTGTVLLASI